MADNLALVGSPNVTRRSTMPRITGKQLFTGDIRPSDIGVSSFVYMGLVTCPYPHAQITRLDVSRAEAAGYVTLTANDLPPLSLYSGGRPYVPLARDKVIFAGQAVAAVGAPSPSNIEDAIGLVDVEYKRLPHVFDVEDALKPDAPKLWSNGNQPTGGVGEGGIAEPSAIHIAYGDADTALQQADAVVDTVLETQLQQHFDLEPRSAVAYWTRGIINIWISTNYAHSLQSPVSQFFGVPLTNVVVRTSLGGYESGSALGSMFGNSVTDPAILATALSVKTGAPVKFVHTRFSHAFNTTARFPIRGYVKFGGKNDGTFTAMKATLYWNMGARGGGSGSDGVSDFYNTYVTPNVKIDSSPVNTNAYSYGQYMRDVGETQAHFVMEVAVDMLAEKLNIDPAAFRLKNMRTKDTAVDPVSNYPYSGFGQPAAFIKARDAFGWAAKWKGWGVPSSVNGTLRRGVGLALLNMAKGALSPPSTGQIQVDPDGTVTVFTGSTDQGAGTNTALPTIASEALGLTSMSNVKVVTSDTSLTTDTGVTAGSRMTRSGGLPLIAAAKDLSSQWFPIVAKALGVSADSLAFGNNKISSKSDPTKAMSFKDAAALLPKPIKGIGIFTPPPKTAYRVGGAKFVEVELDIETAQARVVSYVGGLDAGRIIFAKGAESQVQGGFIGQGIGQALYEETLNDPSEDLSFSGSYLNPNYLDFKVPTIMETPDSVVGVWEEYVDPIGPFGAKGIGEPVLTSVGPAIANALSNALGQYRFKQIPIRHEDIVGAIQWMRQNGKL